MRKKVHRFDASRRDDFFRLHSNAYGAGWCYCVAWWVTTWEGWGERTTEENRSFRERLCEGGENDGYLLYVDDVPVGWCQVGPRDRLEKLKRQFKLNPDPTAWAITCFFIVPAYRRRGLATYLLQEILSDLRNRGVKRVEAFPRRGEDLVVEELWTGPEQMFHAAGFKVARDDPRRLVLAFEW